MAELAPAPSPIESRATRVKARSRSRACSACLTLVAPAIEPPTCRPCPHKHLPPWAGRTLVRFWEEVVQGRTGEPATASRPGAVEMRAKTEFRQSPRLRAVGRRRRWGDRFARDARPARARCSRADP